jgi:hypothetical protein
MSSTASRSDRTSDSIFSMRRPSSVRSGESSAMALIIDGMRQFASQALPHDLDWSRSENGTRMGSRLDLGSVSYSTNGG